MAFRVDILRVVVFKTQFYEIHFLEYSDKSVFLKTFNRMSTDSTCLVARAMPCALPISQSIKAELNEDALVEDLQKLSLQKQNGSSLKHKEKKTVRTMDAISPADFVTLQSLRSSALARKTNTTSKFARDGANLFADLLAEDKPKLIEKVLKNIIFINAMACFLDGNCS